MKLIDGVIIGSHRIKPLIAEAGVLTFGRKENGFKFVDEAYEKKIKFLKFQAFTPENVVSKEDPYWLNRLKQRALKIKDFLDIMKYAESKKIVCFATTHNEYDMIKLSEAGMKILKIGSGDSNNYRMIDMALETGKLVILSVGLLDEDEVNKLLTRYKKNNNQLIIMHTTTIYPTPPELANLGRIKIMHENYDFCFGYSDHVAGDVAVLAAASMPEVSIIEKHLCLPEHRIKPEYESMDIPVALIPEEFAKTQKITKDIFKMMEGIKIQKEVLKNKSWAQKSICAKRNLRIGHILMPEDLVSLRPYCKEKGHISVVNFYDLIGKKIKNNIEKDEHIKYSNLE